MRRFIGVLILCLLPSLMLAQGLDVPVIGERAVVDGPIHNGVEVGCDLPDSQHMKNSGGTDRAGLCVPTSIEHASRWQNVRALHGFQNYRKKFTGGGWPDREAKMIPQYAKSQGLPAPEFLQHTGGDPVILDLALKTGRMPGVTYGYGERYGQKIAHMVNLVYFDDKYACVLDNNFPGAKNLEWMSRGEFLRRWKMTGGGWAIVLLDPPPPPVPVALNREESQPMASGLLFWGLALTTGYHPSPQWGAGGCPPVGRGSFGGPMMMSRPLSLPVVRRVVPRPQKQKVKKASPKKAPAYSWEKSDSGKYATLSRGGKNVGYWDIAAQAYYAYQGSSKWGAAVTPPIPPPAWAVLSPQEKKVPLELLNFGLGLEHMSPAGAAKTYSLCLGGTHVPVSKQAAMEALSGETKLVDDSSACHITCVGSDAACKKFTDDWYNSPEFSRLKAKCLMHQYRPEDWQTEVFQLGKLKDRTEPYLVVQGPGQNGTAKTVYSQVGYTTAQDFTGRLRKADPNFDPNPGPRPNPPRPGPNPEPEPPAQELPPWLWVLLVGGGAFLALRLLSQRQRQGE